jgi:hypothetical protein
MPEMLLNPDFLLLLLPILVLQLALVIYCGRIILKEGVRSLNRLSWFLICLFVNIIGPFLFLLLGRKKEYT